MTFVIPARVPIGWWPYACFFPYTVGIRTAPSGQINQASLSPDNRWVAYQEADDSGLVDVWVAPMPPTGERWQVSSGGGAVPVWAQNGRELFYLDLTNRLMTVPVQTAGARFNAGVPVRLLETAYFQTQQSAGIRDYDVWPDAQRFLMMREHGVAGGFQMRLIAVVNWFAVAVMALTALAFALFASDRLSIETVSFGVLVALIAVIFVVSSDPPIALFTLFCGYALSGYVYWMWRWFRGESNPAKPVPAVPASAEPPKS